MCFRDMTFCIAKCGNTACPKMLTERVRQDAQKWWKGDDAPIAVSDLSPGCSQWEELK